MTADLLSRLSAATEGSAELDREILEALGWTFKWRWHRPNGLQLPHGERAPRPTRSLDDITRMIEEAGMEWQSGIITAYVGETIGDMTTPRYGASHPDRRLALVLAFLRAREAGR